MIKPGICSITFRDKSPEEVIKLSVAAGLRASNGAGMFMFRRRILKRPNASAS
jgi:hypothetical protein